MVETMFFHFDQNNSGGYFVRDDEHGVCESVIVEAIDGSDAWRRLQSIGDNVSGFNKYCECCGERWSEPWEEGDSSPKIYGSTLDAVESSTFLKRCFVHTFDGTFTEHKFT